MNKTGELTVITSKTFILQAISPLHLLPQRGSSGDLMCPDPRFGRIRCFIEAPLLRRTIIPGAT